MQQTGYCVISFEKVAEKVYKTVGMTLKRSDQGIVRVYNVSNRSMPALVKAYRFFEQPIAIDSIKCS